MGGGNAGGDQEANSGSRGGRSGEEGHDGEHSTLFIRRKSTPQRRKLGSGPSPASLPSGGVSVSY